MDHNLILIRKLMLIAVNLIKFYQRTKINLKHNLIQILKLKTLKIKKVLIFSLKLKIKYKMRLYKNQMIKIF